MKIVVIGSGSKSEDELCSLLRAEKHDVHHIGLQDSLIQASRISPEFIIIKLDSSAFEKIEIFEHLKDWPTAPLIVLTSARLPADLIIRILDAGAADLLSEPYGNGELLARMRAIRRRVATNKHQMANFSSGSLQINFVLRQVFHEGKRLPLTRTEYNLLRYLVLSKDRLVTHKQLQEEILGQEIKSELLAQEIEKKHAHALRVHINNLRNKLEKDPANPAFIQTETRLGYRFRTAR